MTFASLKTDTFRRLGEDEDAPAFWSEEDVEMALNDAYMELSDAAEWYERVITVDLLQDRPYYDGRLMLPRTLLTVGAAFNEQTNRWLLPIAVPDLDQTDRRWERVAGEPEAMFLRGLWWIGYWPRVHADSGTLRQSYTALPDPLSEDADEPGFPETFHPGLVEYALADLWPQAGELDAALAAWTAYLAYETGLQAWVLDRASVPMVRGYGGNAQLTER